MPLTGHLLGCGPQSLGSSQLGVSCPAPGNLLTVLLLLSVCVQAQVDRFRQPLRNPLPPECNHCDRPQLSSEKVLIQRLLNGYSQVGKNGRPVLNVTTVMNVTFGLGLIQMDLDEKYKVLKMSMWSQYFWRDEYLVWDPADYGGLSKVRLASNLIWLPDIMLYNSADPKNELRDVLAVVHHDGRVHWVPHQIFKSSCSVDVTNFPFDYQNCHMWFGSWTHTSSEIDVNMAFASGIDLSTFQSDYLDSSDWKMEATTAFKDIMPSVNDTPNFGVLKFQLHMKRKLVFSSYILTLPCVFLACLTLVVFWLPPDRPDRTALAMSIFASFLVLLLILVEAVPATASSVPVLGVYYCFNLVIIMMSVFLSSLVVNVCRAGEGTRPVPYWLKVLALDGLGRLLLVRPSYHSSKASAQTSGTIIKNHNVCCSQMTTANLPACRGGRKVRLRYDNKYCTTVENGETCRLIKGQAMKDYKTDCQDVYLTEAPGIRFHIARSPDNDASTLQCEDSQPKNSDYGTETKGEEELEQFTGIEGQMWEIRDTLHNIQTTVLEKYGRDRRRKEIARAWHDVALVLDRLFFIMYIILIVVSLVTLFPRPK